ncbi:MAG: ACT domain-containing protein, partial [Bacteroidales bacterium]|nr:ACT domain-containing protein [Bacteroidales bacterium]
NFCFISKTDEECSLVCPTEIIPNNTIKHDDGWKAFRIEGILDFSLIGILARISEILAKEKIGIIAISTFNTDYIFTREADFQRAIEVLRKENYEFVKE